jgi:hypothetical protein
MSTKSFTFDPEAGVPSAADLVVYGGANFRNIFNVTTTSNTKYDLTGWTGSAQMRKSTGAGSTTVASATFTVGFTSAYDGQFTISLGTTATRSLAEGRYEYNILMTPEVETKSVLDTAIAVGSTVGVGSTAFTVNSITNVAVGDSITVGSALTSVYVNAVESSGGLSTSYIGSASTSPLEVLPGTAVTFNRAGSATTVYNMVNGNILVYAGIASAP